jgi:hypothetical protein
LTTRRQPRSVHLIYGVVSTALLAVIAAVALVVAPPSPPSVAEFAPQAQKTVDEAPRDQSSRFGSGAGSCAVGQVGCEAVELSTTTTTRPVSGPAAAASAEVLRTRVRRCVGEPPRQTEDPQSPPCVNFWTGDNGGATTRGVTRDEIKVVLACTYYCGDGASTARSIAPLVDHFNRRYELYGRRLTATVISRDSANGNGVASQQYVAQQADDSVGPFAVLGSPGSTSTRTLFRETARRKMIGISGGADDLSDDDFSAASPYLWSYAPSVDELERQFSAFACASLVGRPARHGGTLQALSTRKFAIATPKRDAGSPGTAALVAGLRRCGVVASVSEFDTSFTSGQPPASVTAMVGGWQTDEVTSVISLASAIEESGMMTAASRAGYEPEWLHAGLEGQENPTAYQTLTPQDQSSHVFGISARNKPIALVDQPWYQAVRETAADYAPSVSDFQTLPAIYRKLLVLVSGIQMSGPRLTPQRFERALHDAVFPNPNHGAAPYWQAAVSFGPGDWWMTDDVALTWYEPSGDPGGETTAPTGGYCYVDRGARWSSAFPNRDAAFFDRTQPCR